MDLHAIRAGLATIVQDLGGLPAEDALGPWTLPGADLGKFKVRLTSVASVGRDELRDEYDPDVIPAGDTYTPQLGSVVTTATGNRRLTVTVLCEMHDADTSAWPAIEAVRDKLRLPGSQERLAALGVATQWIGPTRDVSTDWDGRTVSECLFEWVLNASSAVSEANTTIETVLLNPLETEP